MKKILALITALSLALSMFAICAFADEENDVAPTATFDEATADEATADEATADEATADEATADEATADEATADEATADEATADEATADEASEVIGDINGDGVLDIVDVVIARAYIVGNEYPADANIDAGDVNFDGVLDIVDVVIMRAAIINNTPIVAPGTDPATADEATSDEATADEATSDEATADEATADEATADEVTLFEGTFETGNWNAVTEGEDDLFGAVDDAAEGGVLTITFTQTADATSTDPAQIKIVLNPDWYVVAEEYGLATDATTYTVTLTAEQAEKLANATAVFVQGKYLVITGATYTAA